MKGSQMFIIYANAAGTNVTLSPRLSRGHNEPSAEIDAKISLLEGSGIANGNMTANIFCQKCNSWNGGSMNLSGPGQSWIWASKQGNPIRSDSTSAHIQQHDDGAYADFALNLDLLSSSSSSSNPFLDPKNQQAIDAGDSSAGYDGAAIPIHGVIMCLAFIIGFPLGAFLIRLASFRGLVWIHAAVQSLSYLGAIIGLGLGVYIAKQGAANVLQRDSTACILNAADSVFTALLLPPYARHRPRRAPRPPAHPGLRPPPPIQTLPNHLALYARARLVRARRRHRRIH